MIEPVKLSGTMRRVFGALLLIPVVFVLWYDQQFGGLALCFLAVLMGLEVKRLTAMPTVLGYLLLGLIVVQSVPHWIIARPPVLVVGIVFLLTFLVLVYTNYLVALFVGSLSLCLGYAGFLLSQPSGNILLIALAAIIAMCDSAAYFVGRHVGGPKLWQQVSPKKTVSGSVGGLIGAMVLTIFLSDVFTFASLGEALIVGLVIGVLAQAGDLFESAVKRHLKVKDSGSILPGHGGMLDRFDGYVFAVPAIYFYLFGI
ncbi:phosphatidate cytidylyltransferase [Candidatus Puniceispirillum sp.]|nr:phosphatidate cytidylyltransferase [Candidatus Puniceispirillum sp.]